MKASPPPAGPLLVMGVGNPLMTDDGVGIAAIGRLRDRWVLDPRVELIEAGWPLSLLPEVEVCSGLMILDAINANRLPGTVVELERDEIPRFFAARLSPHQLGVRELLALCSLRGCLPSRTVAIGIEPAMIGLGTELSPIAERSLDPLLDRVAHRLAAWGFAAAERREARLSPCTR